MNVSLKIAEAKKDFYDFIKAGTRVTVIKTTPEGLLWYDIQYYLPIAGYPINH